MRTVKHRKDYLPADLTVADVLSRPTAPVQLTAIASEHDPTPGANKTERRYAAHLNRLVSAGEIARWWWKPGSLRIAPSLHYQPDFLVQRSDRILEVVDVKGARGERFWCEEDAWVKIKTVARLFPFRMVVTWEKRGLWLTEIVGGTDADHEAA